MLVRVPFIAVVLVLAGFSALAQAPQPLRIETAALPAPVVSAYYNAQLQATGGQPPYRWSVIQGNLPAGLRLDPSGLLVGTASAPGPFRFTVRVTDSATPRHTATRAFSSGALPALEVRWKRPPRVEKGGIFGAVAIANHLPQSVDITLLIVGVNEFNKAFVLGYQHFTLAEKTASPEIPFGFTLPRGYYVVYADAYAEVPSTTALYHVHLQIPSVLQVT